MKIRKKNIIKAIFLFIILFYLCSTLISYSQYRSRLNEKYGKLSSYMRTTFFYKESLIINTAIVLVVGIATIPVTGLMGVGYDYSSLTDSISTYPIFQPRTTHALVKVPFMDKPFEIELQNGEITRDTFDKVFFEDPKKEFNHLYSDWLKKQIGFDDKNVEFKMWFGKIDFENINNIEDDGDEYIFNLFKESSRIKSVYIKNIKDLDDTILKEKNEYINNELMKKIDTILVNNYKEEGYYLAFTNYNFNLYEEGDYFNRKYNIKGKKLYEGSVLKNGERYLDYYYCEKDGEVEYIPYKYNSISEIY
ncbi:MAG: hypothetical protein Q4G04_06940 [bacterium]|nr:hypothetical protein [bacterium]